jgi:hypothetical protein
MKSFKNDTHVFHNAVVTATTEVTIVTSFGTKKNLMLAIVIRTNLQQNDKLQITN